MSRQGSIWKKDFFFKLFLYLNKASYTSIRCGMIFSKSNFFLISLVHALGHPISLKIYVEIAPLNTAKVCWGPWRAWTWHTASPDDTFVSTQKQLKMVVLLDSRLWGPQFLRVSREQFPTYVQGGINLEKGFFFENISVP